MRHLDERRDMEARHNRQSALKEEELKQFYRFEQLEDTIAEAQGRLLKGGFWYRLRRGDRADRQLIADTTAQIEHGRWREQEALQPLRNQQRDEREGLEKNQKTEARVMADWIDREMESFTHSLDTSRERSQEHDSAREAPSQSQQYTRGGGDSGGRSRVFAPVPYF